MVEVIKTQLLDGDVYGRRILTMQTRSVTLSVFPKNNIESYGGDSVLEMHCVYFLLNVHKKQIKFLIIILFDFTTKNKTIHLFLLIEKYYIHLQGESKTLYILNP